MRDVDMEEVMKELDNNPQICSMFEDLKNKTIKAALDLENEAVLKFLNKIEGTDYQDLTAFSLGDIGKDYELFTYDEYPDKRDLIHKPTGQKLELGKVKILHEGEKKFEVIKVELPVKFYWSDGTIEEG
jgi:hypothetical protein